MYVCAFALCIHIQLGIQGNKWRPSILIALHLQQNEVNYGHILWKASKERKLGLLNIISHSVLSTIKIYR